MKIPKAKKMTSGNWYIRLRLGGESVSIVRNTEREAIRAAELMKAEYRNGKKAERVGAMAISEAVDAYISARSNVLSPATIRGYRIIQRNRFQRIMGRDINARINWQAEINAEAALCSAKTLKNAFLFLSSALKEQGIAMPPVKLPQIVANEHEFLTPEQIPIFLDAIRGTPVEIAALLALHSLRRSELLAVERNDISGGFIDVHGSVVPDEKNIFVEKKTNKNTASRRTVPIVIPRLVEAVKETDGKLVQYNAGSLNRSINRICAKANLPQIGLHGLRHSFASLAYHLGLSEREVMDMGGWADEATMRKIYTHISARDKRRAANKMAEFYSNF